MVENAGTYSLRGGILDVYPLQAEHPVRLDFFDEELEEIRTFDVFNQRSNGSLESVSFGAMGELNFTKNQYKSGELRLAEVHPDRKSAVEHEIGQRQRRHYKEGLWWQRSAFEDLNWKLLDFFSSNSVLFSSNLPELKDRVLYVQTQMQKDWDDSVQAGNLPMPVPSLYGSIEELESFFKASPRVLRTQNAWQEGKLLTVEEEVQSRGTLTIEELEEKAIDMEVEGTAVYLLSPSAGQAARLRHYLRESHIHVLEGSLHSGFGFPQDKVAFYTDHQLFNKLGKRRHNKKVRGQAVALTDFHSLEKGDLVIHRTYGLGRFAGVSRIETEIGRTDVLLLQFSGKDRLSLPVSDFRLLEKYVGKEGKEPNLDKLGGKKWDGVKARVKKKVVEIAKELVELYAKRELQKGHAFAPDGEDQFEFEDAFPWPPTQDQVQAIREVKFDMESGKPMDRLVCGDVGFGKTEVAMRAAFKAVHEGKQVAVLVPTTILAQQHFENFQERFASWPVRIEMVSRYKSAKEKKEILAKANAGKVDILVGTHALLTKSLQFKNLGLFIIDEEQKFGVKQKEKLREFRLNVDTLCLSATPIPRTLHLSLSGVRDISTISTPPRNRLPVETRVVEFDAKLLKRSIEEELNRGGQVFFVNDHIRELDELGEKIHEWIPDAKLAMAHGQLPEKELERVFSGFVHREFDILLSTNIVESGIDIPSVNTIVIHNAQNFGMSQLYQLRGRVGRGELKAHAYLVYPKGKKLSQDSQKRLSSLEMYTDLGSGFKLAMRDLEIRGAGNLLGTEQSGFIAEIGYETYLKMVKEVVAELQGQKTEKIVEPKVDLGIDAFLPEYYIEDGLQRLNLYQRLSKCTRFDEVENMAEEMKDRFGGYPEPVGNLLASVRLRMAGRLFGFGEMQLQKSALKLVFAPEVLVSQELVAFLVKNSEIPLRFSYNQPIEIYLSRGGKHETEELVDFSLHLQKLWNGWNA